MHPSQIQSSPVLRRIHLFCSAEQRKTRKQYQVTCHFLDHKNQTKHDILSIVYTYKIVPIPQSAKKTFEIRLKKSYAYIM